MPPTHGLRDCRPRPASWVRRVHRDTPRNTTGTVLHEVVRLHLVDLKVGSQARRTSFLHKPSPPRRAEVRSAACASGQEPDGASESLGVNNVDHFKCYKSKVAKGAPKFTTVSGISFAISRRSGHERAPTATMWTLWVHI
jgi:hypothetical protein